MTRARVDGGLRGGVERLGAVLAGGQFAAFFLSVLAAFFAMTLLMLFWPASSDGLGALAHEFRTWCFGLDPATGRMELMYVVMLLADPLILAGLLLLVWWRPLRALLVDRGLRALIPHAMAAVGIVFAGVTALFALQTPAEAGPPPFPAEALRVRIPMPAVELVDQRGERFSLASLRGRPVVLTSVYTCCVSTCPLILAEMRKALDALPPRERAETAVVAISMDPKRDTPAKLAKLAERHGLDRPNVFLLTGAPSVVDPLLDRLGFERRSMDDGETIDHVNLFLALDREGDLAYRLALGSTVAAWLPAALRVLHAERAGRS